MNSAWIDVSADPVVHLTLRAGLALLFVSAAAHKLRDLDAFVATIEAYAMLPPACSRPGAALIVGAEWLVGAGLVVWGTAALPALGAALLLAIYTVAVAVNLHRGRRDLACGCGGPVDEVPIGSGLLARNGILLIACLLAALPPSSRPLTLVDTVTGIGLLGASALMYAAIETARANAANLRRLVRVDTRAHLAEVRR